MNLLDFIVRIPGYVDRAVIIVLFECLIIHEVARLWNASYFKQTRKLLLGFIFTFGILFAVIVIKRAYQLIPF